MKKKLEKIVVSTHSLCKSIHVYIIRSCVGPHLDVKCLQKVSGVEHLSQVS